MRNDNPYLIIKNTNYTYNKKLWLISCLSFLDSSAGILMYELNELIGGRFEVIMVRLTFDFSHIKRPSDDIPALPPSSSHSLFYVPCCFLHSSPFVHHNFHHTVSLISNQKQTHHLSIQYSTFSINSDKCPNINVTGWTKTAIILQIQILK